MLKSTFHNLLAVVMATVLAGIIIECATRLFGLAPPMPAEYSRYTSSPYLAFGPEPFSHTTGRSGTGEYDYDYKHNSYGLRDDEHALQKPEGVFRILGLGDSFTYGSGANYEQTYLFLLERILNARTGTHPHVEIIKAGVSRFFPEPERMLLERLGKKFEPDLVIVAFVPNDVLDTYLGLDAVVVDKSGFLLTREAKELGPLAIRLYKYSHLCRLVLSRYVSWRIGREHKIKPGELYKENGFYEAAWVKVEQEYQRMARIAGAIGAELLVVHIPQKGPWTEQSSYPPRRLEQWARANGVKFLDCLPALRQAPENQGLYYPKDGHLTPPGYAIVADELAKYLTAKRLVP